MQLSVIFCLFLFSCQPELKTYEDHVSYINQSIEKEDYEKALRDLKETHRFVKMDLSKVDKLQNIYEIASQLQFKLKEKRETFLKIAGCPELTSSVGFEQVEGNGNLYSCYIIDKKIKVNCANKFKDYCFVESKNGANHWYKSF
jgi:hypothetical protein